MKYGPVYFTAKNGLEIELRSAEVSDAPAMLRYLKTTAAETPYLVREADEITLTLEQEEAYLQSRIDAERELLLAAFADGEHIGNCSMLKAGKYRRYAHRCVVGIALVQAYCGIGIGRRMLQTVLDTAKETGYEQAELEVMADNKAALALYEKLGFQRFGTFPQSMRYADGHYGDAFWMMKRL